MIKFIILFYFRGLLEYTVMRERGDDFIIAILCCNMIAYLQYY
jgi:hypothetical protein